MADWEWLRENYKSEITTDDWIGAAALGGLCVMSALRWLDGFGLSDGIAAVFMLIALVNGAFQFRRKLRSMREQDRMDWAR